MKDSLVVHIVIRGSKSNVVQEEELRHAARRHPGLWLASNIVLALVLYVVLDFDRPKRGLILIDQTPLIELRASLK